MFPPICSSVFLSFTTHKKKSHGNPYEAHVKDDWSDAEMLETFPQIVKQPCRYVVLVCTCSQKNNFHGQKTSDIRLQFWSSILRHYNMNSKNYFGVDEVINHF